MGLRVGNVIVEHDGREFDSVQYREQEKDGAPRPLRVLRDGEIETFDASPGKLDAVLEPAFLPQETLDAAREKAGIATQTVESETSEKTDAANDGDSDKERSND